MRKTAAEDANEGRCGPVARGLGVRSLQVRLRDASAEDVARAVEEVARRFDLNVSVDDLDKSRGTFAEAKNPETGRPVAKAWKVNENLMVAHARGEEEAAELLRVLLETGAEMSVVADLDHSGPFRDVERVLKGLVRELSSLGEVEVVQGTVKKGNEEHPMYKIVDKESGKVLLKVYVRAPRKRKWMTGGQGERGGAWGCETTATLTTWVGEDKVAGRKTVRLSRWARKLADRLRKKPDVAAGLVAFYWLTKRPELHWYFRPLYRRALMNPRYHVHDVEMLARYVVYQLIDDDEIYELAVEKYREWRQRRHRQRRLDPWV